jgi:hypothetical protein
MGDTIQSVSSGIGRATDRVNASIAGTNDLTELFSEIDHFVRTIIAENGRLAELQSTD